MARSIVSRGTETLRAASTAAARRALRSGSGPPSLAATRISRTTLPMTWPRLVAFATRPACFHCAPTQSVYRLGDQRSTVSGPVLDYPDDFFALRRDAV